MLKAPSPSSLASLSYLVAAAIPIGAWAIMLLVAGPERLTIAQAVGLQLQYTFSEENPLRWWFITWALAQLLLLVLSVSYVRGAPGTAWLSISLLVLGGAITAASVYLWPSVFLPAACGVYCAWRAHKESKPYASE